MIDGYGYAETVSLKNQRGAWVRYAKRGEMWTYDVAYLPQFDVVLACYVACWSLVLCSSDPAYSTAERPSAVSPARGADSVIEKLSPPKARNKRPWQDPMVLDFLDNLARRPQALCELR